MPVIRQYLHRVFPPTEGTEVSGDRITDSTRGDNHGDGTTTRLESDRPLLMSVCYRLVGAISEAEDAVQEAYARWYALSDEARNEIGSSTAWLVTTASRICLDILGSARVARAAYVGEWLPEPISDAAHWTTLTPSREHTDPAERLTIDESVSMALLVVLETMTPAERVAFVLHDVFGYPYDEIGVIVGRSSPACRQLASSARRRVRESRPALQAAPEHDRVVSAFKSAWDTGELVALIALLDPESTAITDGGGLVSAAIDPIRGPAAIATFLLDVRRREPDLELSSAVVNGQHGLVVSAHGHTLAVIAITVKNERIHTLWALRNPHKLRAWS
jgi:RNA polymerase sigma factor (sigma-70 family)